MFAAVLTSPQSRCTRRCNTCHTRTFTRIVLCNTDCRYTHTHVSYPRIVSSWAMSFVMEPSSHVISVHCVLMDDVIRHGTQHTFSGTVDGQYSAPLIFVLLLMSPGHAQTLIHSTSRSRYVYVHREFTRLPLSNPCGSMLFFLRALAV